MRKALLVTLEYPPQIGGVANYYVNLVKNLSADKIEVLTNKNNELLAKRSFLPWLKSFKIIKKIVQEKNIEVILVGQVLPLGTVAWLLSKYLKIPYIVFTHAMDVTYPQKYPRKKLLMQKIFNGAEKIITVSRYTKYEIYKLLNNRNQGKIEIITPAPSITPDNFPNTNINILKQEYAGHKILLSVGRLVERKGHDIVIKSLPFLIQQKIKFKYIIIGDGINKKHLCELVKKLNLENYVIFKNHLSDAEVAKYYQLCDVFIMPSRETEDKDIEGFGLVYLEANSFAKPVIGGKSGGVEDAIIDGKNGFLVDPKDIQMTAQAILKLFQNRNLATNFGLYGQDRIKKEFQWSYRAKQLEAIIS